MEAKLLSTEHKNTELEELLTASKTKQECALSELQDHHKQAVSYRLLVVDCKYIMNVCVYQLVRLLDV